MQERPDSIVGDMDWQGLEAQCVALGLAGQWAEAEQRMQTAVRQALDRRLGQALEQVLADPLFLARLRVLGGQLGMRCRGKHAIGVILPGGTRFRVVSPYFVKARPQGRRQRKKGPGKQRGRHLALELLGFLEQTSPTLAFRALALSALCPSFATASTILGDEGIALSADKLRSLAGTFDALSPGQRAELSSAPEESLAGKRVLIAVDGGRCREREAKPGRLPADAKRRGFTTEWREPKLFTLAVLDQAGELDRSFPIQADASLGGFDGLLDLLRAYLERLGIGQARQVILAGDGARWIWIHLPSLLADLGVEPDRIVQVLDHTHAKQNLLEQLDRLRPTTLPSQDQQRQHELLDLLWQGHLQQLADRLLAEAAPGRKRQVARKNRDFFLANAHRLQYAQFKKDAIPRGSGIVESAIRRVINLRVKSTGSFWLRGKAETMMFLRAKLLYGRWHLLRDHWQCDLKEAFRALCSESHRPAQPATLERAAA